MARKPGQIIARGQNTWLVRIYQGRDPETGTRKYLNQTIHGPFREAQRFLNLKLQQRDLSRRRARRPLPSTSSSTSGWQRRPSRGSEPEPSTTTSRFSGSTSGRLSARA